MAKKSSPYISSDVFESNTSADSGHMIINIHGKSTSGKTFAACSASEYWPKNIPNKKPITLRDTLHIGWDRAATVGLRAEKIKMGYMVDVPSLLSVPDNDLESVMDGLCAEVHRLVNEDENIKVVIHDTATRMDKFLLDYHFHPDNIPTSRRDNAPDTMAAFGNVLRAHSRYQTAMTMLPAGVISIFLFHQRVIEEPVMGKDNVKKEQRQKQDLLRTSSDVSVIPDITGQAKNLYLNDASLEFTCKKKQMGKNVTRVLCHQGADGARGKSRFEHILEDEEPIDLYGILQRIENACK